ncbi:Sporulation protein YhaL [Bacillus sp. OV322]|uniref:sporulation YhaL family protein n=1 Tax=Bacillus sp. OV322 TaxID=1882764 RepID=UPI0008E4B94B|nr:sporulation YhaL family protein [Bacillus sp. OV322]SFB95431.1 Sporulation protein YhaL [Bacillus sp. OV322]
MPFWIWIIFAGIIVSAIMAVYTAKQDRKLENDWIEKEGQKYIDRMKLEKEKKKDDDIQQGA